MNQTTSQGAAPAPLVPIPRAGLRGASGVILYILLALASATVGIGIAAMRTTVSWEVTVAEVLSGTSMVLLLLHMWRISRRAKGVVPMLILVAVFLAYLTDSLIPSGVLIALIFAVAEGSLAVAIMSQTQAALFPLIPLIAYGATLLISRDPLGSVAALVPFPAIPVLAFGTRQSAAKEDGLTRVGVICATSLALGLSLGGMIVLSLYRQLGSLETTVLTEALDAFRESTVDAILAVDMPDELREILTREYAENVVNSFINMFPGFAVVAINLISVTAQLILHAGLVSFGCGSSLSDRVRVFRMSLISCIVFVVAYIVALSSGTESSTLAGTIATNIYLILLPGLAFAGLLRIMASVTRRGVQGMGCMFYLIIFIPILFFIAPFALAVVEVIGHIASLITSRLKPPEDDNPFGPSSSGEN